jgi:hypothetical protein
MAVILSLSKSKFFPRPYQPDIDGPPILMSNEAKKKLFSFSPSLSYTTLHEQLCLLTDSPGYAAFFLTYLDRYERLLDAKPVLIQGNFPPQSFLSHLSIVHVPECVADDPWKVLVAVMLLNKTAGRVAVPIFWKLIERWPSPESLAKGLFSFPFPSLRLTPRCYLTLALQLTTPSLRTASVPSAYSPPVQSAL